MQALHKEQLGKAIKARREALGFTQKKLADLAHVEEPGTVSRWERGANQPEDLTAVAKALQWTVAEMMRGIEPIRQKDRRGLDPENMTQLDRIEAKLNVLLGHFDLPPEVAALGEILTQGADELGAPDPTDADDAPSARRPRSRRRQAA